MCSPRVGAGLPQPVVDVVEPERQHGERELADHGVVHHLVELAVFELRVPRHEPRIPCDPRRHTVADEQLDRFGDVPLRAPLADVFVEDVMTRAPSDV